MREHRVGSGDIELAVRERGDTGRPTVLLLHGFPDTGGVWDEVAERLTGRFHVVTYDVRGAGASSAPEGVENYRMDLLLEDLRAVIDATSPDAPVHLVGHDWGAIQGWSAVNSPLLAGRIASFTSAGGASLGNTNALLRRMARKNPAATARQFAMSSYIGMIQLPRLPELTVRRALAPLFASVLRRQGITPRDGHPARTLERDMLNGLNLYRANMLGPDRTAAPPRVSVPVQIVVCSRDPYLSTELASAHAGLADRAWVRRVATGHWVQRTRPSLLSQWITEFVDAAAEGGVESREFGAFHGQLVVVTGAGSGIGRATAYGFAANGARVVVADVDEDAAKRTADGIAGLRPAHGTAYVHQVDVADAEAMRRFADEVRDTHGVPDVVVNNAGIAIAGPLLETSEEDWARITSINLDGVYRGCRLFGRQMAERGEGGHLVNIASMAAFSPTGSLGAYSATKAGVLQLSECLGIELAPAGIGVSAICPGAIKTPITRNAHYLGVDRAQADELRDFATRAFEKRGFPPEKVALAIMRAVLHGRPVVPVSPEAYVGRALSRFSPATGRALGRLGGRLNARRLDPPS
ncbi:MAG: short-chain dehydrogenase/reductase [Streptosporangiaceae bacterium]|jgi:NAD(P)-dependent dehydrogenase (short-subunit alcohol dehydrogenase family)/pimeloyl-ACP methyl ester carboxylesterase|nr:short-chain dehydrogenase/reductase [Streptosporangiaceae bacterium]